MNRNFLIFAFAMLLLTGCSSDDLISVNDMDPIRVRTTMTRAAELDLKGLQNQGFNLSSLWGSQVYFTSVGFFYSDGKWNGNSVYYWPKNGNTPLKFFGYSPGSLSDKFSFSGDVQKMVSFEPNSSIGNQIDFVTAYNEGTKDKYGNQDLTLNFRHRLSQIGVKAKQNGGTEYEFKIVGGRIGNVYGTGDYTFAQDPVSNNQSDWDNWSNRKDYEWTCKDENGNDIVITLDSKAKSVMPQVKAKDESQNTISDNAMLIPQKGEAWNPEQMSDNLKNGSDGNYIAVKLQITHKSGVRIFPFGNMGKYEKDRNGKDVWIPAEYAWAAIPVEFNWEPNKKNIYTLIFGEGAGYVAPGEGGPGKDPDNDDDDITEGEQILSKITFSVDVMEWDKEINESNIGQESITLNYTSATLYPGGKKLELIATVPNNNTVTWTSSNPDVANVTPNNNNKAVVTSGDTTGTAIITASWGGLKASCVVTVETPPDEE